MTNELAIKTEQLPNPSFNVKADKGGFAAGIFSGTYITQTPFVSHTAEWAQLSTQRYNLFVLEGESYTSGSFSIKENDALKHTKPELKKQFSPLGSDLLCMPCIFAAKNPNFKNAPNYLVAHVGKLTEIRTQGENIKFCFEKYEKFTQQLINADMRHFNLLENELRNQLDEVHWSIIEGNLLEIIDELGIEIK